MVFWRWFTKSMKGRHVTARIDHKDFSNLPFKNDWNNLVKMYDLRMWYVMHTPHHVKALKHTHELETIHNQLNYLNARDMLRRLVLLTVAFYTFYALYDIPQYDWQDSHEPKHEFHTYVELEEGGDEGDDD